MCAGAGKCPWHQGGGLPLLPLALPRGAAASRGCGSCLWHTQVPGSPCCPGRWRSAPALWPRCARPSCPRGPRCGSLQGRTGQGCWEAPEALALPGTARGGQGSTPSWSQAQFIFWVCPKPESGSSVRAELGCHCLGLPTCFGISQRHLCQPLAAELVLHGAIFTQDAWGTNPGLHRGGTAGASVPRGVWLWGQAQSSSGELHVLGEVDEDQEPSRDGAQHVGAPGKGRQRWGTRRGAQTQVNQLCLPPCGQNPGEVAQAQLHQ